METGHRSGRRRVDTVRSLSRGLEVLKYVNSSGSCRVAEIAAALNLPRPTVYRLLETLEQDGYIAFSASSNLVRVTPLAASLGDGYSLTSQLCKAAGPLFAQYAPKLVWPLDISTYDNAAMVIQETTHGRSPLSIDRGMVGYRLPVLRTSAGRCYLGLCPEAERNLILHHIRRLDDPEDKPFLNDRHLNTMLKEVVEKRLAIREGAEFRPKTASFAVPVWSADRVIACISVIWVREAMTMTEALTGMAQPLREISEQISKALGD